MKGSLGQELPLPSHFEEAAAMVDEDAIAESVVCGPDPEAHLEGIARFVEVGFDHVYVHQVGPDQDSFFDFYAAELLPASETLAGRPGRRSCMIEGLEQSLGAAIAIGVTMLAVTVQLRLLRFPERVFRCAACRRLVRRGAVCPCARAETTDSDTG